MNDGFSAVFTGNLSSPQPGNTPSTSARMASSSVLATAPQGVSGIVNPPARPHRLLGRTPLWPYNRASSTHPTAHRRRFPTAGSYPYDSITRAGTGGPWLSLSPLARALPPPASAPRIARTHLQHFVACCRPAPVHREATDEPARPSRPTRHVNVVGGAPHTLHAHPIPPALATVSYTETAP